MEDSDLVAPEHILPDRELSEHRTFKPFSHLITIKMDLQICRVCLGKSADMVNIFDGNPELEVPIANMMSLVTGHQVSKGDSFFSEIICRSCLQDVAIAFKIRQTYERSHKFFCQLRENSQRAGALEDKICQLPDSGTARETAPMVDSRVKTKRVEDLLENGRVYSNLLKVPVKTEPLDGPVKEGVVEDESYTDHLEFEVKIEPTDPTECSAMNETYGDEGSMEHGELDQCPVKNEPLEEDSSEERYQQISDGEADLSDSQLKGEGSEGLSDSRKKRKQSERTHKCTHCPKSFTRPALLREHVRTHTGERPYKCSHCSSGFKTKSALTRHIETHTNDRPFECSHCSSTFKAQSTLARHLETHSQRTLFQCDLCNKSYTRKGTLEIHRINCAKSSEKQSLLEQVRSRPHKCSECPKSFSEESDLNEHSLTHSGELSYKCPICERSFVQNSSLQRHLRWHKDERTFKCSQCPKSFLEEQQLTEHILIHSGVNPFKCSQCPKTFLLKSTLERHFRAHTGEKPYKCSQCEKSFAFSNHLKIHTLSHTGESPYQCPHCPRSFFGKHPLANHILTHTGERPFKCPHCPKDFTIKFDLQGHIRKHTGERPYKCDICQKSFTLKSNLKNHMFTHRAKP